MAFQPPEQNPKKLFVGSLPFSTTEDELRQMFAQYGEIVELKLIIDRFTNQSKGIAFVEFSNQENADAAMKALNGTQLENRSIIVNIARPPVPRDNFDRNNRNSNFQEKRNRY